MLTDREASADYATSNYGVREWWAHILRTNPQRAGNTRDFVAQMRAAAERAERAG